MWGRDDDKEHYGLIESVQLETDAEDGDYLIVSGRFLMCLLERRIIYPTFNFTKKVSYAQIVNNVVQYNACRTGARKIRGFRLVILPALAGIRTPNCKSATITL